MSRETRMYSTIAVQRCTTAADVLVNAIKVTERRKKLKSAPQRIIIAITKPTAPKPYVPQQPLVFLPPGPDIEAEPEPTIREIQRAVCIAFGIHREEFMSHRRTEKLTVPRHISFVLCKVLTTCSLPQIGRAHSDRDHTTVMYGIRKYEWMIDLLRAELTTDQPVSVWAERAKFHYGNHP